LMVNASVPTQERQAILDDLARLGEVGQ